VSDAPAKVGDTLDEVQRLVDSAGSVDATYCATPSSGRVRVAMKHADHDDSRMRDLVKGLGTIGASVVWERLPSDCWAWVPPAATDPISLRIRDAFDRHHILNRGVVGPMGGHA
jgi:hypothetical protein